MPADKQNAKPVKTSSDLERAAKDGDVVQNVRVLPDVEIVGKDLSGLKLQQSELPAVILRRCNLARAELSELNLSGAVWDDVEFDGGTLEALTQNGGEIRVRSGAVTFQNGSFLGTRFSGDLSRVTFEDCDLTGASFLQATKPPKAILGESKCLGMQLLPGDLQKIVFNVNIRELTGMLLLDAADTIERQRDCGTILTNTKLCEDLWTRDDIYSPSFRAWAFGIIQKHLDTVGGERSETIEAAMRGVQK